MSLAADFGCEALRRKNVVHWVALQGSIGAGKSTLLRHMRDWLREHRLLALDLDAHDDGRDLYLDLDEPVDHWLVPKYDAPPSSKTTDKVSMLDLFYSDEREYSFSFQVMAFTTRLDNLLKALDQIPDRASAPRIVIISERDFRTDRLFFHNLYARGMVRQCDYDNYNGFFERIAGPLLRRNTMMVYVPTEPEACLRRIEKRARLGEKGRVTLERLQSLQDAHSVMLGDYKGTVFTMEDFHSDLGEKELRLVTGQLMHQLVEAVVDPGHVVLV